MNSTHEASINKFRDKKKGLSYSKGNAQHEYYKNESHIKAFTPK